MGTTTTKSGNTVHIGYEAGGWSSKKKPVEVGTTLRNFLDVWCNVCNWAQRGYTEHHAKSLAKNHECEKKESDNEPR